MPTKIKPLSMQKERWMHVPIDGGKSLFFFSGRAHFGSRLVPSAIRGTGAVDTSEQHLWVQYSITDMLVGPHWLRVDGVCPLVVVGGHSQVAVDEADSMGWQLSPVTDINLVQLGAFRRIELKLNVEIKGGVAGSIPWLTYQVQAYGKLANDIGNEGLFWNESLKETLEELLARQAQQDD